MSSIAQVRRVLKGQVQAGAAAFTDYWTDSEIERARQDVARPACPALEIRGEPATAGQAGRATRERCGLASPRPCRSKLGRGKSFPQRSIYKCQYGRPPKTLKKRKIGPCSGQNRSKTFKKRAILPYLS
ncbi:MAG: hypothetical protein FJ288_19245 [Planctomycetes bacterium]|nr:hypothetical protein [Planctomycetota bacterium]